VPAESVDAYKAAASWNTISCILPIGGSKISVTGINLKSTVSIFVRDAEQLTATVLPENATNKIVSWISSVPTVATVTDGLITALAPGTTIITAATQDGNFTAQCTVTVTQTWNIGYSIATNVIATLSNGTLTINGTGQMISSSFPWDDFRTDIQTVIINNGVTNIGSAAFSGCTNLTSVTIGSSVTSIQQNGIVDILCSSSCNR